MKKWFWGYAEQFWLGLYKKSYGCHSRYYVKLRNQFDKIDVIDGNNAYINKNPYKIGGSYKESFKNLVVNFN